MSKEQVQKIEHAFGWVTQAVVIGLLSTVVYFVKDIHTEYKKDHERLGTLEVAQQVGHENHEVRLQVVEAHIK